MAALFDSLQDSELIRLLRDGKIGVLPTDTVYGLVCLAAHEAAVKKLYALKQRQNKPGTIIAASTDQLVALGVKRAYVKAVEQFWPGPVSVVVPFTDANKKYLRQGLSSLPVRIPKNKRLQALLKATGPLLTTSANPPDEAPSATIQAAEVYFRDTIDFYVDGDDLKNRKPSTIIRMVDDAVEVIRQGAVTINESGRSISSDF